MESAESIIEKPSAHSENEKTSKACLSSVPLDKSLFLIVAVVLLFTIVLLSVNLAFQHQNYRAGIAAALGSDNIDHAVVITYTRAWDFAIAKISSMFLAFCLILVGALYVLRSATVAYSLSVANSSQKSSLETGSPGLVMITLGVVLMVVVMFSTSKVEYHGPSVSPSLAEPQTIPADEATPQAPKQGDNR